MAVPELTVTAADPALVAVDVLVLGVRIEDGAGRLALPDGASAETLGLAGVDLASIGMTGTAGDLARLPGSGTAARSIALVGLGAAPDPAALRDAAGAVTRRIRGVESIGLALPVTTQAEASAVLEGAALGAYAYTAYRTDDPPAKRPATTVTLVTPLEAGATRVRIVAEAVALVKDLVNAPPLDLDPAALADRAVAEAEAVGASVRVWDERDLRSDGFGGILGVGAGSTRPPRLVRVAWEPEGAPTHVALVGKGITFDSGGLSLKPAGSMAGMKVDMTGAATVLAVVVAAARLRLPIRATAWLCVAENMPSGSAIRPNDVLRIHGGRTVEVLNTDAEGRLVLADGLVAASAEQPDLLVDVATLTGAATGALGTRTTGAMGDEAAIDRVRDAAASAGEAVWPMPLPVELRQLLNSEIADIANTKIGNTAGGMLVAGHFLREFVGTRPDGETRIPWVHLDIAGTANNAGAAWGFTGAGATGTMVRTLLALLEDAAAAPAPAGQGTSTSGVGDG